ncbi:MAG: ComEC/Rec2-related protein [Candidatus Uhrbacteria bacterium GW2011_GWE2_40_58]|nr:MAG: ComEC/Rec2-related protein [Candidatus Uhrbacteria bacterium GW2011_GWE2_40_58]OGL93787.1 MAG: hypothetical protein A2239_03185 [Candidatus Uhrbacteria bacterium RIFOXYA2_FULL_40_9]OGL98530.1 MAG: hypothetical protein A2332_03540 [Candidatus Uhrbacteria bacterium RIFOXYB2_FULL_41_18]
MLLQNWWTSMAYSPSRSFAVVATAFCIGIAWGEVFARSSFELFLWPLACLIVSIFLVHSRVFRVSLIILLAFVFGLFRTSQASLPSGIETLADHAGRSIRIEGRVSSEVEHRLDGQHVVLDHVFLAERSVEGKLLVFFPLYPKIDTGDRLVFTGTIQLPEPFEGFAYDHYLATKGILGISFFPQNLDVYPSFQKGFLVRILSIKQRVVNRLQHLFPEPHASFLSGLLFGGSSSLSSDLKEDFSRTGVSHILAASGFNVSLFSLVFLGWILQTPLGRKRGLFLTAVLLVLYVLMAGATPAVVRAGVMASLLLVGTGIRRKASMRNVLLLTLAVMLLVNPKLLFWDVGFQLSFIATTALIFVVPQWKPYFLWIPDSFGIRESFVGSLAAIVCTIPLILWQFGSISFIAPLSNLLILPVIPFVMALSLLALLFSVLSFSLALIFVLPAWALSFFILHIIVWFGSFTWAQMQPEWAQGGAIFLFLGFGFFLLWNFFQKTKRNY